MVGEGKTLILEKELGILTKSSKDKRNEKPGLASIHQEYVISGHQCEKHCCYCCHRYGRIVAVEKVHIVVVSHAGEVVGGI